MTAPAAPEKKEPEKLKEKLPPLHVAAQVASTLACTLAASFLGPYGTVIGLAGGTLLSTTLPTAIEHFANRTGARVKEKYEAYRKRGIPEAQARAAAESDVAAEDKDQPYAVWTSHGVSMHQPPPRRRSVPWLWAGIGAVTAGVLSFGALYGVEAAAGKPVSYVVQGRPAHGTTFGGYTAPAAAPSTAEPSAKATGAATGTGSASRGSSVSPSVSSSVPVSVSPSVSLTPGAGISGSASASSGSGVTVTPTAAASGFDSGAPGEGQ